MKFAKEAWPWVLPPALLAPLVGWLLGWWTALVPLALALFILFFFRDPSRSFDGPPDIVTAPADGRVLTVDTYTDPDLGVEMKRVVTFLSVFNVHVQRCPTEGKVVDSVYRRGKKLAAFKPGIEILNESHLTVLERNEGHLIGVRQITGLVARRVVAYLDVGDQVQRGEHLGVIKFGSRVDLMMPMSYEVMVKEGDTVKAGETQMAMPTDPST